jgi:hypothetical protein
MHRPMCIEVYQRGTEDPREGKRGGPCASIRRRRGWWYVWYVIRRCLRIGVICQYLYDGWSIALDMAFGIPWKPHHARELYTLNLRNIDYQFYSLRACRRRPFHSRTNREPQSYISLYSIGSHAGTNLTTIRNHYVFLNSVVYRFFCYHYLTFHHQSFKPVSISGTSNHPAREHAIAGWKQPKSKMRLKPANRDLKIQ